MAFGKFERDRESDEYSTDGTIDINGTPTLTTIEDKTETTISGIFNTTNPYFDPNAKNMYDDYHGK